MCFLEYIICYVVAQQYGPRATSVYIIQALLFTGTIILHVLCSIWQKCLETWTSRIPLTLTFTLAEKPYKTHALSHDIPYQLIASYRPISYKKVSVIPWGCITHLILLGVSGTHKIKSSQTHPITHNQSVVNYKQVL